MRNAMAVSLYLVVIYLIVIYKEWVVKGEIGWMGRGDLQIAPTMAEVVFVGTGLLTCPLCAGQGGGFGWRGGVWEGGSY